MTFWPVILPQSGKALSSPLKFSLQSCPAPAGENTYKQLWVLWYVFQSLFLSQHHWMELDHFLLWKHASLWLQHAMLSDSSHLYGCSFRSPLLESLPQPAIKQLIQRLSPALSSLGTLPSTLKYKLPPTAQQLPCVYPWPGPHLEAPHLFAFQTLHRHFKPDQNRIHVFSLEDCISNILENHDGMLQHRGHFYLKIHNLQFWVIALNYFL